MNLSAPSTPPRPSLRPLNNGAAAASVADKPKGDFADFFAEVAQRGPSEGKNKASAANLREPAARHAAAAKSRARAHEELKTSSKTKAPEAAPTCATELSSPPPSPAAGAAEEASLNAENDSGSDLCEAMENSGEDAANGTGEAAGAAENETPSMLSLEEISDQAIADLAGPSTEAPLEGMQAAKAAEDVSSDKNALPSGGVTPPVLPKNSSAKAAIAKLNPGRAADFAETNLDSPQGDGIAKPTAARNFLTASDKWVAERDEALGINVAKSAAEMSSNPLPPEAKSLFATQVTVREVGASTQFSSQTPPAATPVANDAHVAVEAAMEASEKLTTANQHSVNLRFSTGGGDLSVRVEMHNGQVRATFRTDSAELRSALAHEWQSLSGANGDRAQRFADPVFATASEFSSTGNGGENPGYQRGQDMRQPSERFEFSAGSRAAPITPNGAAVPLAPSHALESSTVLRLHTFA